MKHMNDYDIDNALRRFVPAGFDLADPSTQGPVPRRAKLAILVNNLADWTNGHSDGWAYWLPPRRSAQRAIGLIESTAYPEYSRREVEDVTEAEFKAAVRPIKAFLTKQGVFGRERDEILRPVL